MLNIIVAVSENGVIGKDGKIPWNIPEDLKHFKEITTEHTVIMGRKTFESIGKPLPNRRNIVISRNPDYKAEGVYVCESLDDALATTDWLNDFGGEEVFVIGGASLYQEALGMICGLGQGKIYLTNILKPYDGDTYFPYFDQKDWKITSLKYNRFSETVDGTNIPSYEFIVYER